MRDQIRFFFNRMGEHLWIKPLVICVLSVLAAFVARIMDRLGFLEIVPDINVDSLETLLTVIAGGMLGVAVFAVGSMLSAYGSASSTATPRSFPLVIADDVSQNALSVFIGAFIYSIVAFVALKNGYYGRVGRFALFLVTVFVFAVVILSFIRWIDRIARLGRLGHTIDRVEEVTAEALRRRRQAPTLGAKRAEGEADGTPIYADRIGYVQRIDVPVLQALAERFNLTVTVVSLPGAFSTPDKPLAYASREKPAGDEIDDAAISEAFVIGKDRVFDEDPRFGLVVLSEIASRALSPAVNDPGTAIDIIGALVRLFTLWIEGDEKAEDPPVAFDRVAVPEISLDDMFDDAFNAMSRDGAGTLEVGIRLQKAFNTLASIGGVDVREAARSHAQFAFRYAERALQLPEEIEMLRTVYRFEEAG
jgi:uncharacterized membrane protein